MAGAGLPRKARARHHRDPPGQCHRPRQDRGFGRPCQNHHLPRAWRADLIPFKDAMRCPIHVDEIAEIFARVIMADHPKHWIYNTGGVAISLGEIADIVREYLPDARISFDKESGGKEISGNYLIDNRRLVEEFGVQYRPYRERVLQIINEVRREEGRAPIAAR